MFGNHLGWRCTTTTAELLHWTVFFQPLFRQFVGGFLSLLLFWGFQLSPVPHFIISDWWRSWSPSWWSWILHEAIVGSKVRKVKFLHVIVIVRNVFIYYRCRVIEVLVSPTSPLQSYLTSPPSSTFSCVYYSLTVFTFFCVFVVSLMFFCLLFSVRFCCFCFLLLLFLLLFFNEINFYAIFWITFEIAIIYSLVQAFHCWFSQFNGFSLRHFLFFICFCWFCIFPCLLLVVLFL